jgi:hypothetical protein
MPGVIGFGRLQAGDGLEHTVHGFARRPIQFSFRGSNSVNYQLDDRGFEFLRFTSLKPI